MDPFAWWDIAATYDKYAGFFDLVIYCSIFIALAHTIFTSRFTGRPGKVMATAIGLALGISLAVVEQQFGWNLREAGPFAVLIALLLLGFLILHVLLRVHVSWTLAVPLSYVIVYLLIRAMSPALFRAMSDRMPFINLLTAIIFLICIWQIGVALWPKGHGSADPAASDASFISAMDRKTEDREMRVEKRIKRKLVPEAQRETARLERNLHALRDALKKNNPDLRAIEQALSDVAHRSDDVIRTVDTIKTLDRRLRNFDWHELQELSGYYRELNSDDQNRLKEQIQLERAKIVQEHAVMDLADRCERRHQEFRGVLDQATRACGARDRDMAIQRISRAIEFEDQQKQDLERLRHAEKRLLSLTRWKIKREVA